jgi:DNA-directed RNA polymerase specialized sigma24 family protein
VSEHNQDDRDAVRQLNALIRKVTRNVIADDRGGASPGVEPLSLDGGPGGDEVDLAQQVADPNQHPENDACDAVLQAQLRALFNELLRELSRQQATILQLDLSGPPLSNQDIARILKTSAQTVASQRVSAKTRLRHLLERRMETDPGLIALLDEVLSASGDR